MQVCTCYLTDSITLKKSFSPKKIKKKVKEKKKEEIKKQKKEERTGAYEVLKNENCFSNLFIKI